MQTEILPQFAGPVFLTDGGMETTLIFHEGIPLPEFASFVLLKDAAGRATLRRYYRAYAEMARRHGMGFVLESPTWRASADWGQKLGFDARDLAAINREAIGLMHELREEFESPATPMVISGNLGPRGDGYLPSALMTAGEAARYHAPQIRVLRDAGADCVSAFTLNYIEEARGIADAAAVLGIPSVISFTVETDGRLPSGHSLREAIETVDRASVCPPAAYMINCAHPDHLGGAWEEGGPWLQRIRGLRANASRLSHAELNDSTELDAGDPAELGCECRDLRRTLTHLTLLGGCCGTDHRHVESIARAWKERPADTLAAAA